MTTSDKNQPTILSLLEYNQKKGVALYLNGRSATPDEIASRCVNEEPLYMPDYVMDEAGILKEIRYDEIIFER